MLQIPDNFSVFFYSGDQSLQLSTVCLNLFGNEKAKPSANFLTTGTLSEQARNEASKYCTANIVNTKSWAFLDNAEVFYYCDNEPNEGVQINDFPFDRIPAN